MEYPMVFVKCCESELENWKNKGRKISDEDIL
jgi:hypothetical protein